MHEPVRISGLVAWRGEKRTLTAKEVHTLVEELVARAVGINPSEATLTDGERAEVAEALALTLLALGEIGMNDVQAVRLGHRTLAHTLKKRAPAATKYLSANATYTFNTLLEVCCLHILNFFTQRSTFIARTLVEATNQLEEQSHQLGILIGRIPQPVKDSAFEHRYGEYVISKYGMLRIFGLRLRQEEGAAWPLEAAYLSLEAAPVDKSPRQMGPIPRRSPFPMAPRRIEQLLPGGKRILLQGHAGSGKTTLLQWMAVSMVRRTFPQELAEYNDCIPFFLQLRTLTRRGNLPNPSEFLASTGNMLADAQPEGWVNRVLESGRAFLLIDGVDEVPQAERERTREWLRELLSAYPKARCLVTVRPSAVQDDYLRREGFAQLSLLPMGRDDIVTFIAQWHDAARSESKQETEHLNQLQQALMETVAANPSISRLAENPLMCSLICALHRDQQARLPQDRKGLYESALELLLVRRDTYRSIEAPEGIELSKEAQIRLLSRIAAWLIMQRQSEADQEDVVEGILAEVLPAIREAHKQGGPHEIFRYLLLRSGLLHAPTEDSVAFIHRTFQDYLGAKALQESRYFSIMVRNAHDNQWEDVIRMAVGHAQRKQSSQLLSKLVKRGDDVKKHRHRLHLLAAACLEDATELDPAVRQSVEDRLAVLVPPQTIDEAYELAAAGSVVLPLLPQDPDGLGDEEAAAVVATARQIGGDPALALLRKFRHHTSPRVQAQLNRAWHAFDCDTYADGVISHLPADSLFQVHTAAHIRALLRMGGRTNVHCSGSISEENLSLLPETLKTLYLINNETINDLDFVQGFRCLSDLTVGNCPRIRDIGGLRGLGLRSLTLLDQLRLESTASLGSMPKLEALALDFSLPWDSLAGLPVEAPLTSLYIGPAAYTVSAVRGISRWVTLKHVSLSSVGLRTEDYVELARLPLLESLNLAGESIAAMRGLGPLPGVAHLAITDAVEAEDLTPLRECFPNMRRLSLLWSPGSAPTLDLEPLHIMKDLIVQVTNGGEVTGAGTFPEGRALVTPRHPA
ncbi:NACHT domain-containing protein [Streptomyces sp. NPDC051976]|uniref:NACHT domain-containing protein n=1 Tax=Streptomyces sp. NPDC051976 TaxID=3154947 RepID=UPI0034206516